MANKFKKLIACVATAAVFVSMAPVSMAAKLTEPVKANNTDISEMNKAWETEKAETGKGNDKAKYDFSYEYTLNVPYVIEYDMTVETPLRCVSKVKNNREGFTVGIGISGDEAKSGWITSSGSPSETTQDFAWYNGNDSGSNWVDLGKLNIGETYTIQYIVTSAGVEVKAVDAEGKPVFDVSGLPVRGDGNPVAKCNKISITTNAREEGTTDTVTIDNATMYNLGPDEIDVSFGGEKFTTEDVNRITYDGNSTYPLTATASFNGSEMSDYDITLSSDNAPTGITVDNNGITVDDSLAPGTYDFVVTAALTDYPESYVMYDVSFEMVELSDEQLLEKAMGILNLDTTQAGISFVDGVYTVYGDFTLPSVPSKINVDWTVTDADGVSPYAHVEDNKIVWDTTAPKEYRATLKADVTCGGASDSKTFELYAPDLATITYYNLDFEDFASGAIVNLTKGSDTKTYASKGLEFAVGTRNGGDHELSVSITSESGNQCMVLESTNYATGRTPPTVIFTNNNKAKKNNFVIEADLKFSAAQTVLRLSDVLNLQAPNDSSVGAWLHYSIANIDNTMNIVVYDSTGKVITYYQDDSAINELKKMIIPADEGGLVYIDNLVIKDTEYELVDEDVVDGGLANLAIAAEGTYPISLRNGVYTARDDFNLPADPVGTTVEWSVTDPNGSPSDVLAISNNKAVINPELKEDTTVKLVAAVTTGDITKNKEFTINVLTPASVIKEVKDATTLVSGGKTIKADKDGVYNVTDDLELSNGDYVKIVWSSDNGKITPAGVVMPKADDDKTKLVATYTYKDATDSREFVIAMPNVKTAYIDTAIAALKATSNDDATKTFAIDAIGTINYDIKVPKTVKAETGEIIIDWTVESDVAKITDAGVIEYTVSDKNAHEVKLTPTFTYKKNGTELYKETGKTYTYNVQFTDDAADKYKVRMDAAYDANFTSIPSNTTSSITFPEKGYFGSSFTWNSSVPTVISNQGKYTRPSTTKSVVLTVSIEAGSAKESKQFNVTVPGSAGSSGGGGGGGSVSSSGTVSRPNSTGSISTSTTTAVQGSTATNGADIVDKLLEEKEQANDMFADVKDAAWARTEINGLAKAGIINGISDTQFAPNATVTRAEFAKMLMGAFGLSSASYTTSSFGDVATDAWYFQDVETAYNLGIINGVEDGVFAPDALITRQDMAVMVTRAADTAGKTIAEVNAGIAFADAGLIGSYAQTSVDRLVKAGIINGVSDTSFAPLDNATRAQAAKILYNFL